jgi:hypothetical protein
VQFFVIPTVDGCSSPEDVLQRLDDYKRDTGTEDGDTLWLCIDRDRWDEGSLARVIQLCGQKGYGIALSNPCFELWVLLHYEDLAPGTGSTREVVEQLEVRIGVGYKKKCCRDLAITEEMVHGAVNRARGMETDDLRSLTGPRTRVYLIIDALIERDQIRFS